MVVARVCGAVCDSQRLFLGDSGRGCGCGAVSAVGAAGVDAAREAVGALFERRGVLVALFVAILSYHAVNLPVIQPDRPDNATGANVSLSLQKGCTLNFMAKRLERPNDSYF